MLLQFNKKCAYNLIDETRIETVCGAFYKAMDLELERTVAVKCVGIQGNSPREKNANYLKALSEVKTMVRISEEDVDIPEIYAIHYDEAKSMLYIVMQWIRGKALSEHMHCPEKQFLNWMIDLCNILEIMERKGIYHKDIKPDNIMITDRGKLYLIDFNISLSTPNLIEGTANYKAPEMSPRSKYVGREKVDMFAIGVMMYEYYTGSVPIHTVDYAKNRQRGAFEWDEFTEPKAKNPQMSDIANSIILTCMKLDPKQRYQRISALKNDLRKAVWQINGAKQHHR